MTLAERQRAASKHAVPGATTSLLSVPSKMPGLAFGLPAGRSCPYKVLGEGSICGSCYAEKGNYLYSNVQRSQQARFAWTVKSMATAGGREQWITTMVTAISAAIDPSDAYFRIHDSGDFFSPAYVKAWAEVARRLPYVKFWAPTRSYRATAPAWQEAFAELNALPNVTVRPSALHFGDIAPVSGGFSAGSTAMVQGFNCPAHAQGNQCGDCRACWNDKQTAISYRKH